jgi:thiamine-phosphate pyrophosphorylase
MDLTVCSSPDPIQDEQDLVKVLFEEGMTTFHLRKPKASEEEMKLWIEGIDVSMRKHLVIHSHWKLAAEFELKGIHIGAHAMQSLSQNEINNWIQIHSTYSSTSVHNMQEAQAIPDGIKSVWLSPVFESISKTNYKSSLTSLELDLVKQFLQKDKKTNVYALGGISSKHITELKQRNFDGAVVLGALWNNIESSKQELIQRFRELHTACNTTHTH